MSKNRFLVIILLLSTFSLRAQYTRLNIEAYAGFPANLTFFSPALSTYGGVGVKYALTKELSVAGHIAMGTLTGKNSSAYPLNNLLYTDPNNFLSFSNNFFQYTLEGQLNLERILGLRRYLHKLNPFLVVGGGIESSTTTRISVGGLFDKTYSYPFQTVYIGLNFKYYLNPTLDLTFGANFNSAQTYYNDAVPAEKKMDNYLLSYVGVSYKVGARKDKQHIEWNNVILKDRIYIPDPEKHMGQPLDLAGNYFIFHKDSIAKLQASNAELQQKSKDLENKTADLTKENKTQQKQIDSIQNQVNVIKQELDTLKTQKSTEKIVEKPVIVEKIVVDTSKISSSSEKKIIAQLQTENNDLRVKDKKLEQKSNEQQKQLDEMQHQLNQVKKQIEVKPDVKTTPIEEPAKKAIEPVPVKKELQKKKIKAEKAPVEPTVKIESSKKAEVPIVESPTTVSSEGLNKIDNVTTPIATYNVIAGAYAGEKYAMIYRNKLRSKGLEAAVFKSDVNSKIYRVCVFSSDDKLEATKMMKNTRIDIEPQAWIHVYHKK
jgi:hypothetical protein